MSKWNAEHGPDAVAVGDRIAELDGKRLTGQVRHSFGARFEAFSVDFGWMFADFQPILLVFGRCF